MQLYEESLVSNSLQSSNNNKMFEEIFFVFEKNVFLVEIHGIIYLQYPLLLQCRIQPPMNDV